MRLLEIPVTNLVIYDSAHQLIANSSMNEYFYLFVTDVIKFFVSSMKKINSKNVFIIIQYYE